jgi:hypothetical protein
VLEPRSYADLLSFARWRVLTPHILAFVGWGLFIRDNRYIVESAMYFAFFIRYAKNLCSGLIFA